MKKILFIIFIIAIFVTGGILGYKKIVADEREKKIIQMFNKDILDNFVENKKSVIERLKISTPEEANEIYNDYLKISQLIIENINTEHLDFLNNIYNKDSEYYFTEKDWKTANKFLNNYDLEIFDLAETEVRIMEVPNYYYNIFKDYVTDDYREYLEITYKENEEPYFTDGSILVPYDKIADRLLTWENFLKKYPNSDLAEIANEKCNTYRRIYILGSDNAPTREGGWENNELFYIPENNLKEFNRFIEKYPDSPTVELIKFYLENYKNENIYELIKNKIFQKFEKDQSIDVISENLGKMIAIKGNYENYILADNNWIVDLSEGYIYSGEKEYPIQIIGISSLKEDGSETWTWAWEYSDNFNEKILTFINNIRWMGRDLKLGVFYNSKLKLSDEVNANILSIIACGISGENLAFDNLNLAYTELQGTLYYAIKDLPNEVFSPVDLREFSDIIVSSIDRYTLNHKLFIESFLEWNKTKYKWQGNSIIADFGKDGELKIDFEKVGDKLIFKELKN